MLPVMRTGESGTGIQKLQCLGEIYYAPQTCMRHACPGSKYAIKDHHKIESECGYYHDPTRRTVGPARTCEEAPKVASTSATEEITKEPETEFTEKEHIKHTPSYSESFFSPLM